MSHRRILIVEDNPQNMKLVRDLLQYHGYETRGATSAEEGLELAFASPPDLVLMDIQLPGMDGIAAFQRLREDVRTRSVPVMAITASVMAEEQEQLLQAGFDAVQKKPISIRDFLVECRRLLGEEAPGIP